MEGIDYNGKYKSKGLIPDEDIEEILVYFQHKQLKLQTLYLQDNNLSVLPTNFSKLSTIELEDLILSDNPNLGKGEATTTTSPPTNNNNNNSNNNNLFITTTLPQLCSLFRHLRGLSLAGCGLLSSPSASAYSLLLPLTRLQQLAVLDLSNNPQLKAFPSEIVNNLPHLEKLYLTDIGMSGEAIPPSTFSPSSSLSRNLSKLVLSNNRLTAIPSSITNLSKLQSLWINDNQLLSIPLGIAGLPLLKDFYCVNNPFVPPLNSIPTNVSQFLPDHPQQALSLLRNCLEGTAKYEQIKLIVLGNGGEGKVL